MKNRYRNAEYYYSPTEGQALENIMHEEYEKRKKAAMARKMYEEQQKAEVKKIRAEKRKEISMRRLKQIDKNGGWRLAWTRARGTVLRKKEGEN